jgi:hypothetical protein
MSSYWVLHTVNREEEQFVARNSSRLPLWEQIIAGPISYSEAKALVKHFETEPEKNEAFSLYWAVPEERLHQGQPLGVHQIGPDVSPEEVRAIRLRLMGKEDEPAPRVSGADCVAFDTLGLVVGLLKDSVIYSPYGQRLGHIERVDAEPHRYWVGHKYLIGKSTGYLFGEAFLPAAPARDPAVPFINFEGRYTLGYLTPDGVMHRLGRGEEMGVAGKVDPLEYDPLARVALGAVLVGAINPVYFDEEMLERGENLLKKVYWTSRNRSER